MTTSIINSGPLASGANTVAARFRAVYGANPLRIFRAPGRVNLIGEHTDYNDGFVMPAAIDFYSYAAVGARTDRTFSVYSEQFKETVEFNLDQLAGPPRKHWSDYVRGVAATLCDEGCLLKGANLVIDGQVPIGSGLSSSAAIEVATAFALTSRGGASFSLLDIAKLCQRAENTYTGTRCGIMDQFISCLGRQNHALMLDCRSLDATYLQLPPMVRLVICNTMVRHELAAGEYNMRRASCERGLKSIREFLPKVRALRDVTLSNLEDHRSSLTDIDFRRCRHVITENIRVMNAKEAFESADLARMGELMYESHESLHQDYEVSCDELNLMVDIALDTNGVYGARMTGGGFGGCTINLVEAKAVPEFQRNVSREYEKLTGICPQVFVCCAAEGASEIPM